jgi:hypothetical protein
MAIGQINHGVTTDNNISESLIQAKILKELGCREDCRIWRRNVGAMKTANGRTVKFGTPGEADIQGILKGGTFIAIEVKTKKGRLSKKQINWGKMILKFGGIYTVARSVEDAVSAVNNAVSARIGANNDSNK